MGILENPSFTSAPSAGICSTAIASCPALSIIVVKSYFIVICCPLFLAFLLVQVFLQKAEPSDALLFVYYISAGYFSGLAYTSSPLI
jgi:hypothetical protein